MGNHNINGQDLQIRYIVVSVDVLRQLEKYQVHKAMKPVKIESYSQLFFWRKWLQSLGQSAKNVHIGLQIFQHDTCRRPTQLARSVLTGIKSLRSDQSAMEIGPINNEDRNNKQCRPDQSSIMVKTSLKKDAVVKDENLAWALAETALSACFKVVLDLAMFWF